MLLPPARAILLTAAEFTIADGLFGRLETPLLRRPPRKIDSRRLLDFRVIAQRRQRKFWVKLIEDGIRLGEIKPEVDPEALVDEMLVELHGLVTMQLLRPTPKMRAYARDRISKIIAAICTPQAGEKVR